MNTLIGIAEVAAVVAGFLILAGLVYLALALAAVGAAWRSLKR